MLKVLAPCLLGQPLRARGTGAKERGQSASAALAAAFKVPGHARTGNGAVTCNCGESSNVGQVNCCQVELAINFLTVTSGQQEHNTMASANETTLLSKPEDWWRWSRNFQFKASSSFLRDLWPKIDPARAETRDPAHPDQPLLEPFLTEPTAPDMANFKRPGASSAGTDPVGAQGDDDATQIDLQNLIWDHSQDLYTILYRAWESEVEAIRELKDWVLATVSDDLVRTACPPGGTIREWFKQLQTQLGITPLVSMRLARARYKKATQIPAKPPRDPERWLMEWELAVIEAKATGVPETESSITWWDDFESVIRAPGISSWTAFAQTFVAHNSAKIDNNEINCFEVARAFRLVLWRDEDLAKSKRIAQKDCETRSRSSRRRRRRRSNQATHTTAAVEEE
jgi:hypothetical protein